MKVLATSDAVKLDSTSRLSVSFKDTKNGLPEVQKPQIDQLWKEDQQAGNVPLDDVEKAVETINDAVEHVNRALRFSIHEDTQRVMVRVVNVFTDEVIKEIPPEEVLDTVARIREMIGLLIDERA